EWSGAVVDQDIICIFTRQKPGINRIITFFSALDDTGHFCKAISVNDLRTAVSQSILPRHQYNIIDQGAVLKTAQRIIKQRFSSDLQKLFLYFTVHSFSQIGRASCRERL